MAAEAQAKATLRADQPGVTISPNIYGQFAEHLGHCIYGGIWVGENSTIPNTRGVRNDVLGALKKLKVPFVRWPGGCFADEYHWKDGIGPRELRPRMINTHWGGVVEDNSFGTHEFLDFCELLGTKPYVSANVGSGTVQEMMEWVEYMTSDADSPMANLRRKNGRDKAWDVPFIGVGNESWGCGGNMRAEYYADQYRKYATYVKNYQPGKSIARIAGGPNASDYHWTEVLMREARNHMQGLSLHYYTLPTGSWSGSKGVGSGFPEADWFATIDRTLFMEELVQKHSAIMDKYDPQKKIPLVVDEWGTWYDVEPGTNPGFLRQAATMRDAMVAAINLNIFHRHAERVTMTAIAQMVNVLQAMIFTEGEKMALTTTYHVFEMYTVHQGATYLPLDIKGPAYVYGDQSVPAVYGTASRDAEGRIHVSLTNVNPHEAVKISVALQGVKAGAVTGRVLTGPSMDSGNTIAQPNLVVPQAFTDAVLKDGLLEVVLPSKSVVALELK